MKTCAVLQTSCWLAPLLAMLVNLTSSSQAQAGEVENSATQFANRYIERLKSGDPASAISEMWDMDTLLGNVFGLMYLELPAAERTNTQRACAEFFKAPFANGKVAEVMAAMKVQDAKASIISDSLVAVTLTVIGKSGQPTASTLLLSKSGNAWKVLDQKMGPAPSMRAGLALMWAQGLRNQDKSIAGILTKAAEQIREHVEKQ